jgi:nicotinamidase-related amidase
MIVSSENTAVLVIDLQERLLPAMHKSEELLANCMRLLKGTTGLNLKHYYTQQYTKGLGDTVKEIKSIETTFTHFEKKSFSALGNEELNEKIKQNKNTNIIISGIEAHVCVLQTCIQLKHEGFNPIVVTNCISSRKTTDYEMAIERFKYENLMLATYESVLFELIESAESPNFKQISRIVK